MRLKFLPRPARQHDRRKEGNVDAIQEFMTNHELYDDLVTWGLRIFAGIAVFVIGRWVAKAITKGVKALITKRVDATLGDFVSTIVYAGLLAVIVIAALGQVGVETTSLIAMLGAAGLAVGLAMRDSLSNLASGVVLMILRPYKAGDLVEVAGKMATVDTVQVFHTMLTTFDGEQMWVPNGKVTAAEIINYSANPTRRVDVHVQISYGDDIDRARQIAMQVIAADERVLDEPEPQVLVVGLGDDGIDIRVRPWVRSADWWATYCELTEELKVAFEQGGCTIPFPQRDIHMIEAKTS